MSTWTWRWRRILGPGMQHRGEGRFRSQPATNQALLGSRRAARSPPTHTADTEVLYLRAGKPADTLERTRNIWEAIPPNRLTWPRGSLWTAYLVRSPQSNPLIADRSKQLTGLGADWLALPRHRFGHGAHVRCLSKGRKARCTPLRRDTVAALHQWLRERQGQPTDPLFPSQRGGPLSRDSVEHPLAKQVATAAQHSLRYCQVTKSLRRRIILDGRI